MRRPANARREGANEARRGRRARDAGADERKARGGTAGEREARGGERGAALDAGAGGALARRWRDAGHGCGGDTGPWPGAGAMPGGRRGRAARGGGRTRAGCPPRVARRCTSASEIRAPCGVRVRDRGVLRELGAPRRVRRTAAERGRERERVDAKCDAGQVSDEAASQTRAGCDRARSYRPSAADTMRPYGAADKRGADATNDHETKRGARARGRGAAECFT